MVVARNSDDWDLCWNFQSGAGCRNSRCRWRHENPGAQLNRNHKLRRSYNGSYDQKSEKKRGRPFDECENWGLENQYDLLLDAEIDNIPNIKNTSKLLKKFAWQQAAEHFAPRSTCMSRSSSAKSCAQSYIIFSRIISPVGSDSESDIVKKVGFVTPRVMSKDQKRKRFVVPQDQFEELLTPQTRVRGITTLSPFAKVFKPSAKPLLPTNSRRTFEGTTKAKMNLSGDLVGEGHIIQDEKVWE